MRISRIVLFLLVSVPVSGAALPISNASAAASTTVIIAGQATGFLPAPCNCLVTVYLAAQASGSATSLEGAGTNHATTGVTNHFTLSGATAGSTVTLSGSIDRSTAAYLIGSRVTINADSTTGAFTFTLGPITGGPFAGQTFVFVGSGTVLILD